MRRESRRTRGWSGETRRRGSMSRLSSMAGRWSRICKVAMGMTLICALLLGRPGSDYPFRPWLWYWHCVAFNGLGSIGLKWKGMGTKGRKRYPTRHESCMLLFLWNCIWSPPLLTKYSSIFHTRRVLEKLHKLIRHGGRTADVDHSICTIVFRT